MLIKCMRSRKLRVNGACWVVTYSLLLNSGFRPHLDINSVSGHIQSTQSWDHGWFGTDFHHFHLFRTKLCGRFFAFSLLLNADKRPPSDGCYPRSGAFV